MIIGDHRNHSADHPFTPITKTTNKRQESHQDYLNAYEKMLKQITRKVGKLYLKREED
jgi:hypothetical protein